MKTVVFCLEEPSAREMLMGLVPRVFNKRIATRFVVILDQDASPCREVKKRLKALCEKAGRPDAVVRIACRELESWYLGDLAAVGRALKIQNLEKHSQKAKYRKPDDMPKPSKELKRLTRGLYQKVSGSREIGRLMSVSKNRSGSFNALIESLIRLTGSDRAGALDDSKIAE